MANNLIGGTVFIKVDGTQYAARGGWKVQPNSNKKTGVAGQDAVHGFTQVPVVPYVEGEVTDLGGLSLQALQNVTNSTVTAELANGKVYTLRNAWYAGEPVIDTTDGKVPVRFEGISCNEQVSS